MNTTLPLHSSMPNSSLPEEGLNTKINNQINFSNPVPVHPPPPSESYTFNKKLFHLPMVLFSRESIYRGLIESFAVDVPSCLAAATRNKTFFLETIFETLMNNFIVYATPSITKLIAGARSKAIFNGSAGQYYNYMLFNRADLDNNENFDKARNRILEDEVSDNETMLGIFGNRGGMPNERTAQIQQIKDFMENYKANDILREKILQLKDDVIKAQSWVEGMYWGFIPLARRLFRKYVLGQDRFTGTLAYLSNEDNNKLGNEKGFSLKQILGTFVSMSLTPFLVNGFLKLIKDPELLANSLFVRKLKEEMDTSHGFHPKLGLFISSGELSFLISRIFNAQDMFEMLENVLEFFTSAGSLLFGDRVTNGVFAKSADAKLAQEFKTKPGILYEQSKAKPGSLVEFFDSVFPRASKYVQVLSKCLGNNDLIKKASQEYSKVFYKGFATHGLLTFGANMLINLVTRLRVKSAMKS
jgi:hypothetical protein